MAGRASSLARDLAAVYALLIAYATLHPLTGWRDQGLSPFAWLGIWPKAFLYADLSFNFLAYVPLGMLAVWAVFPLLRGAPAALFTAGAALALSCALESLQSYLPSRIPSLADFATNGLGALAGAILGSLLAPRLLERGALRSTGDTWLGARTPRGLILAGLWLFASLYPQSMLFGHGNLLAYFGPVSGYPFTPLEFVRVEAAVTGASLFAAGMLLAASLTPAAPRLLLLLAFVLAACAVRTASQTILFTADLAYVWLTPGAQRGLIAGTVALLAAVALPRAMQLALVAIAVTFATVVVNLAPANPYYAVAVAALNPGRFLNFNGLTQALAALWPFLAAVYVMFAIGQRGQRGG